MDKSTIARQLIRDTLFIWLPTLIAACEKNKLEITLTEFIAKELMADINGTSKVLNEGRQHLSMGSIESKISEIGGKVKK